MLRNSFSRQLKYISYLHRAQTEVFVIITTLYILRYKKLVSKIKEMHKFSIVTELKRTTGFT